MRTMQTYVADDGTRFDDPTKAHQHEALCREIDAAMARLPKPTRHQEDRLRHGEAYVQHNRANLIAARGALLAIADRELDWFTKDRRDLIDPQLRPTHNFIGRVIDDTGGPLARAWGRICRIDEQGREWDQPYRVSHPTPDAPAV